MEMNPVRLLLAIQLKVCSLSEFSACMWGQRQNSVVMCQRFPEINLGLSSCLCAVKADMW